MAGTARAPLAVTILRLLGNLPLPLLHAIGTLLGLLFYLIPNRHKQIARRNLELCLPELDRTQRNRLLRRSLIETGKSITELPLIWYARPERVMALIHERHGEELVHAAKAEGRGIIMASPHLGCWELGGLYISTLGKVTTLYRPPRQAALEAIIKETRERMGATLVPTDRRGVRELFQTLKRGEIVGILPDQDPRQAGVFAPFFGIPASTMTLFASLARKSNAAVVVGFAERLPWGRGYITHLLEVPDALYADNELRSATVLNQTVEKAIRMAPAQYQWTYKRFRTRPEGESAVY